MNTLWIVLVIALVTAGLRLLPVLLLGKGEKPLPQAVTYLGKIMPAAIIGLLVIYSLKGTNLSAAGHGIPELCGVLVAAGLQYWRKNTLLSIFCATAVYMVFIRIM